MSKDFAEFKSYCALPHQLMDAMTPEHLRSWPFTLLTTGPVSVRSKDRTRSNCGFQYNVHSPGR
jgi:hypothetical protein